MNELQKYRADYCYKGYSIHQLIAARFLIVALMLAGNTFSVCTVSGFGCNKSAVAIVFFLFLILSAVSYLYARKAETGSFFVNTQFLLDVLIITSVIYITGGSVSPFLFLYLPLVMAASVIRSRASALLVTVCSLLSYAGLIWLLTAGIVAPAGTGESVYPQGGVLVQLLGLISAMSLIAVASSYLVNKIAVGREIIEASINEITDLAAHQKGVMDGVSEGVITTNLERAITSMNKAAANLLKISESDFVGESIERLLGHIGIEEHRDEIETEICIPGGNGNEHVTIAYRSRPIFNSMGKRVGIVSTFQDVTKLREIEEKLMMQERMARMLSENGTVEGESPTMLSELVGESQVMRQTFRLIERVSKNDANVIISGESGTGKGLAAKAIHASGSRSKGPFVAVDCGAIPENLIESELFGHKKGSFTGADSDYVGLFRQGDGGTVFLDEIGELPLQMQTKLLRVIQEKAVRPVGGESDIPIDVRIIAATNRDLRKEVTAGRFREDLFYRLNVVAIKLPPLRDRMEDVPVLVNYILKKQLNSEQNAVISPDAMNILTSHTYPGNVRELENIIERALVLGGSVILPEHLDGILGPEENDSSANPSVTEVIVDNSIEFPVDLDHLLQTIERNYLEAALSRTGGIKKKAAGLLGMNFRSFRYRLQKYDLNS